MHLGMIARTSIMHYKDGATTLDQIGRELGVQYVLEGSVRREGEQVRVTANWCSSKTRVICGRGNTIATLAICWRCKAKLPRRLRTRLS